MRRVIAHLDIDAFYAGVELARRPELRGRPVIVSGSGPRAVVTTASYEARRFGVRSAMPTARARRLCPDAVLVAPDFPAYRARSGEVWDLVRGRVPTVALMGLDEAFLDLSEVERPVALLRELVSDVRAATGLTISVGLGPNRLVAKVASDLGKPAGFVAMGREEACRRLASHPPGIIPGIGPKTAARLAAMGIDTVGALRAADPAALRRTFPGEAAAALQRRSRFEDDSPVAVRGAAKSRSAETTFDRDVASLPELERALEALTRRLCASVRRAGVRARTIAIKVRLADFTTVTRARSIASATDDPELVLAVAVDLLRAYAPPQPVRLVGVRLASLGEAAEPARPPGGQLRLGV